MKTFSQFCCEAYYDTDKPSDTPLKVGRVGADRRKSDAELKRKTRYKPRKDIGTNKPTSKTVQQPEKERGTAGVSGKEAQRKAYRERKAREGGTKTKSASELLSKGNKSQTDPNNPKYKPSPKYKPQKARYTGKEGHQMRQKLRRAGDKIIKDIRKGK